MKPVNNFIYMILGCIIFSCTSAEESDMREIENQNTKDSINQSNEIVSEIKKLDNLINKTRVSFDSIANKANEIILKMDSIESVDYSKGKYDTIFIAE